MDTRYLTKTKKPKSGRSRNGGRGEKTNSLHVTGSRPAPSIERTFVKADAVDVIQYAAIDRRVEADGKGAEKTWAHYYESRNPKGPNSDQAKQLKEGTRVEAPLRRPKMVHLPFLHSHLYLSDEDWILGHKDGGVWQYKGWPDFEVDPNEEERLSMQVIINLSGTKYKYRDVTSYFVEFSDDRVMPYKQFKTVVDAVSELLHRHLPKSKVLIHCGAGTNRSVAAVLGYALKHKNIGLQDGINMIEGYKKEKYPDRIWDTLTNPTFRAFLRQYEIDYRR